MTAATPNDDTCLVVQDAPAPGTWNMAIDEALLESAERSLTPVLRWYTWSEPTLSLGYFQDLKRRREHIASLPCAVVRRTTGGGAILHHHELTYSLTLAAQHRLAAEALSLYRQLHGALARALAVQGVVATLRPMPAPFAAPAARPFLCFLRQGEGDLLVGSHKVAGSAQRRLRGGVLQHGSLLWTASEQAPELPGLTDLAGPIDRSRLLADWLECLSMDWQVRLTFGPLPPGVRQRAIRLVRERYSTGAWLHRR